MPRYKLTIEYDGTGYAGWQKQKDVSTIAGALLDAALAFSGQRVDLVGSGRTDAGVHALGQVAHLDFDKEFEPYRVMQGLNYHLLKPHPQIVVTKAEQVDAEFSARFSATRREYVYRILNRRTRPALEANRVWQVAETLDEMKMNEAATLLVGEHDFTSFRDSQCQAKSPIKLLEELSVARFDEEVHIRARSRSFLHHQIRIFAGTLWQVGTGRSQPEEVLEMLAAKNRAAAGQTAPPEGLYFVKVEY